MSGVFGKCHVAETAWRAEMHMADAPFAEVRAPKHMVSGGIPEGRVT